MLKGLSGKSAVVTGAGGAIGQALTRRLVGEGVRVAAVDVVGGPLDDLAAELGRETVLPIAADVTDGTDTRRFVDATVEAFGSVDLFLANAGVASVAKDVADFDEAEFHQVFSVNVLGAFLGAREATRRMLSQPSGGSILFTASVGALKGVAGMSVYTASKHAVLGLSRSLAMEVGGRGIRVNALCPGGVDTRMMHSINEGQANRLGKPIERVRVVGEASQLLGRYATTEEVAAAAAWVLSDECAFMHNEVVTLTGGAR